MVELNEFGKVMFSFEAVRRLNRVIKESAARHKLIGLGVYGGSNTARNVERDYFDGRRSITSKVMEGYYIARQMTIIVGSLEGNGNESLIKKLEQETKALAEDIPESELGRVLGFLLDNEGYVLIGNRVEKKILGFDRKTYSDFRRNPDVRMLNELLLKEEEAIRHGLVYELKR